MTDVEPNDHAAATSGRSRRWFLKITGTGMLGLFTHSAFGDVTLVHAAPIAGGTLAPQTIPKFASPLAIPPAMPTNGGPNSYEIVVTQFEQQILPPGWPETTVWSYASATDIAGTRSYPAFTIEALRGEPVTVTWVNGLLDTASGEYLPHLLPVDPTLHWANPPGGTTGRDMRPAWDETPGPYDGPVPVVVHVHGMEDVEDWADGYTEAWYLPAATNIPAGHATVGTWYEYFEAKSGSDWAEGTATFRYPNSQRPATLWFHDHTLGMTRANVYAGPAGFYVLRSDRPEDNPTIVGGGTAAVLPEGSQEIPLAIQDRSFDADGSLFYPDSRAFFDGYAGPSAPTTDVAPIWNPEFFGNCIVVNGRTWPYLDVEPRRYRLRLLNGCQSRFLLLSLRSPDTGAATRPGIWQIGSDSGFLRAPVATREVLLAPAERADVIVDFSAVPLGTTITMVNRGPDAPFGGGGFQAADPQTTGLVMQFRVNTPLSGPDRSTPPAQLVMPSAPALPDTGTTRPLALVEVMSADAGVMIPVEALLGTNIDGAVEAMHWDEEVSENPGVGDVETWELYNFTADAHPIHVHDVAFEVIDRQPLGRDGRPTRRARPAGPSENGFKDTVVAYPGEVTRVRMRFGTAGRFVWHCHVLEHEDNEMMRPLQVGDDQPGQPER